MNSNQFDEERLKRQFFLNGVGFTLLVLFVLLVVGTVSVATH